MRSQENKLEDVLSSLIEFAQIDNDHRLGLAYYELLLFLAESAGLHVYVGNPAIPKETSWIAGEQNRLKEALSEMVDHDREARFDVHLKAAYRYGLNQPSGCDNRKKRIDCILPEDGGLVSVLFLILWGLGGKVERCPGCGELFLKKSGKRQYCKDYCRVKAYRERLPEEQRAKINEKRSKDHYARQRGWKTTGRKE